MSDLNEDTLRDYIQGAERAAEEAYEAQLRAEGALMVLRRILEDIQANGAEA